MNHLIVLVNPDKVVEGYGRQLRDQYFLGEERTSAIKILGQGSLEDITATRVTFIGHSGGEDTTFFGYPDFTAPEFARYLAEEAKLPKSVKVIDFISCELGLEQTPLQEQANGSSVSQPQASSFAREFANILESDYEHKARIQAFSNLHSPEPVCDMLLSINDYCQAEVRGVRQSDVEQYRDKLGQAKLAYQELSSLESEKLALKEQIEDIEKQIFELTHERSSFAFIDDYIEKAEEDIDKEKLQEKKEELKLAQDQLERKGHQIARASWKLNSIEREIDKLRDQVLIHQGNCDILRDLDSPRWCQSTNTDIDPIPIPTVGERFALDDRVFESVAPSSVSIDDTEAIETEYQAFGEEDVETGYRAFDGEDVETEYQPFDDEKTLGMTTAYTPKPPVDSQRLLSSSAFGTKLKEQDTAPVNDETASHRLK